MFEGNSCGLHHIGFAAAGLAMMVAAAMPALAQGSASACVATLKQDFPASSALTVDCPSASDCSFLAAPGNATAQELLAPIIAKATSCLNAAGQKLVNEDNQGAGVTRQFRGDGEERCALLISNPGTESPHGVRLICQGG
jgi:hypothetical protein